LPTTIKIASTLNISLDYLIYGDSIIDINKDNLIEVINKASKKKFKDLKRNP